MAQESKIEWTDHTFNPWLGCEKISPACAHCYAESWAKRAGHPDLWNGERSRTSAANWKLPLKWEANASAFYAENGRRQRVFCASLADVFDNAAEVQWRADLFGLIRMTPHLDWLLLTKRIGNAARMIEELQEPGKNWWPLPNVWLGATVANQEEADRDIPKLVSVNAVVRFLSCEPLLGRINLQYAVFNGADSLQSLAGLHWVIVGGESGAKARPMQEEWALDIARQCALARVPFFFKQGSQANWPQFKNFESFPSELQVREWPTTSL